MHGEIARVLDYTALLLLVWYFLVYSRLWPAVRRTPVRLQHVSFSWVQTAAAAAAAAAAVAAAAAAAAAAVAVAAAAAAAGSGSSGGGTRVRSTRII